MNWPKNNNNNTTTKKRSQCLTHIIVILQLFYVLTNCNRIYMNLPYYPLRVRFSSIDLHTYFIYILHCIFCTIQVLYKFQFILFSLDRLGAFHHWPTYYECHPVIIQHFQFNFAFNLVNVWQLNFITPSLFITLETEGQVEDSTPFTLSYTANIIHHTCKAYRKPS